MSQLLADDTLFQHFNSPGQISQLSWAPPCWKFWLECHSGPCDSGGCRWFVTRSAAYLGDLCPTAARGFNIVHLLSTVRSCHTNNFCLTLLLWLHWIWNKTMRLCTPLPCKWPGWGWYQKKLHEGICTPRWSTKRSLVCRSVFYIASWREQGWKAWHSSPQGIPMYIKKQMKHIFQLKWGERKGKRAKPGQSSRRHLDRTAWGHQSSAQDVAANREHSRENLTDQTRHVLQENIHHHVHFDTDYSIKTINFLL